VRWSRSFARAQSCTPTEELTPSPVLSSGAVYHASELRISVSHPPHCELVLSTMSGRCAVVHGRRPCSPSRRPSSRWPLVIAPGYALCTSSSRQSCRNTHAVSHVGVSLGHPHAPCRTMPGQVTHCSAGSLHAACCHRLATGELTPCSALWPVCGRPSVNCFLFLSILV
jgi:hypothetical protein